MTDKHVDDTKKPSGVVFDSLLAGRPRAKPLGSPVRILYGWQEQVVPLSDHPEAAFRRAVLQWLAHLARSEWDAALAMLDEPNSYGMVWTQESILALLRDTFSAETQFGAAFGAPCFTEPATATGVNHGSFGERVDGGFWLDYDVPLNGVFSDLTAQFEFRPRSDGFAMILHDLHVM